MGQERFYWLKDQIQIEKQPKEESEGKGLTPDQKRIHWEAYAKKTERQEESSKGGEGSGNFGHEGRPGEVGGSGGGGGSESGVDAWLSGKNDLNYDSPKPIKSDKYKPTKDEATWAKGLSNQEREGISSWQSGGTNQIRDYQRTGQGDEWTKNTTANLESALDKASPYGGEVYRGLHDLNEDSFQSVIGSKEITLNSVTSATISEDRARFFVQPIRDTPTKSVLFKIDNKTGVNISAASKEGFENEVEVTLRKGTRYKVLSVEATTFNYRDNTTQSDRKVEGATIHLKEK